MARRRPFDPRTWPVRWRLAAGSAALTLAILLIFAAVIGHLASDRIRGDFNREVRSAAINLTAASRVSEGIDGQIYITHPELDSFAKPNSAAVRIIHIDGQRPESSPGAPYLGPARPGVTQRGSLRIVTVPILSENGVLAGFVQYARSDQHVDSTIERLWLFIAVGVLGGVLLACLAGLTIANRAMEPIASLTSAARKIANTRDTSQRMPQPRTEDEVGELALTLEQMLRSLDAARAEREGAMQKQREFVADASHELRTPLTSVIANLELLQASLDAPRGSEDREMVDSALRSSKRMSRLVADLLLLARADAGRTGERRPCDLGEIAADAAAEIAPMSDSRRIKLANGEPVPVLGNRDELHRMVVNLLDNAVRHTAKGGTVELSSRLQGDEAKLEVGDDGPGIPADMRDEVFERFVRGGGPADTVQGGGTGLGLAIVRAVAESHGGRVQAGESSIGGALVSVTLPARKAQSTVSAPLETL